MRSASLQLCLFSLLLAAAIQADVSYELTHDFVPVGGAARAFTVVTIIAVACAIAFAVETGYVWLIGLVAVCAFVPAFFPAAWKPTNEWVVYEILGPIALFLTLGFAFAPGQFKKISLHAHPR